MTKTPLSDDPSPEELRGALKDMGAFIEEGFELLEVTILASVAMPQHRPVMGEAAALLVGELKKLTNNYMILEAILNLKQGNSPDRVRVIATATSKAFIERLNVAAKDLTGA